MIEHTHLADVCRGMLMTMGCVVVLPEPLRRINPWMQPRGGGVEGKIIHRAFFAKAFTGWRQLDCVHEQR